MKISGGATMNAKRNLGFQQVQHAVDQVESATLLHRTEQLNEVDAYSLEGSAT